ncbi:MAG: hypothetical protein M3094_02670 [Actinomycetia bacterium]|nr:hypothetical protein [Actinomycetes bacterium]
MATVMTTRSIIHCTVCGTPNTQVRVFAPEVHACAACARLIEAIHA